MTTAFLCTEERLREIIREEMRAVLGSSGADEWMGPAEAAKMIGCKRGCISALVRRHGLPAYRPGGGKLYTFRRAEVEAWIRRRAAEKGGTLLHLPGR